MAILVQKNRLETRLNMVRLQLFLHKFFNNLDLNDSDLDCAANLALYDFDQNFFKVVVEKGVFKAEQSVRNCMSKLKAAEVIVRDGKKWRINPELSLGVDDVICLQLKAKNDPE